MYTDNIDVLKKLFPLLLAHRLKLALIALCLLIFATACLFLPILNKLLIDNGILKNDFKYVLTIAIITFSLITLNSGISIVKEILRNSISADIYQKLYVNAFDGLIHVSMQYYHNKNTEEIFNDIDVDINNIIKIFDKDVFFVISQILSFLGGFIGLIIIDARLSVLVVLFVPIRYIVAVFFSKKKHLLSKEYLYSKNIFAHWFGDNIRGVKEIRLFGLQNVKSLKAEENISNVALKQKKMNILDEINNNISETVITFLETIIYIVGAYFIFSESLTLGSLFAFMTYSVQIMNPISLALNIKYMFAGIIPSAKRYFHFIDQSHDMSEQSGVMPIDNIEKIEFYDVCFKYESNIILKNAKFSIRKGEKVALIGRNGTGKSTIFHLLEGFYTPSNGKILINNKSLSTYDLKSYRTHLGCMNQNFHLFNSSLKDNITLYNDISEQIFGKILEKVELTELYQQLGDALIGENGNNLSGGQRQKILIARLLYLDRSIYLLDEATSNLDKTTQKQFLNVIRQFMNDKICIIIVHDYSMIYNMDKVLYMTDAGSIDELTTPQEFTRAISSLSS